MPSHMRRFTFLLIAALACTSFQCNESGDDPGLFAPCAEGQTIIYNEADSILVAEFEYATFGDGWELITDVTDATGNGYMRWSGSDRFSSPGTGVATFQINITNPGTYRFIWRSAVTEGTNSTESNDTWLRFHDTDDFYGMKNNGSIVYPGGSGKSPNPNGASSNGWFKVYRSGTPLTFKWQSSTSDNDAHNIFVQFDNPGTYTMEISGRSHGHAIDRFILYNPDAYSQNEATAVGTVSAMTCN